MKRYITDLYRNVGFTLSFLLAGSLLLLSSCEESEVVEGPPSITSVRLVDPALADSTFSEALPGTSIVINGENLATTSKLYINGLEVPFNATLRSSNHLPVTIPEETPTLATDPNVPNTLVLKNSSGETSFAFNVLPPPPSVSGISNEFAKAGESITIRGKNFYFVEEISFPGGVSTTEFQANASGTAVTVSVPEGISEEGFVLVRSQSGTSLEGGSSHFNNRTGIFMNFDDLNPFGWGIPGDNITDASPNNVIQPIDQKFGLINDELAPGYGWSNNKVIDMTYWGAAMFPAEPAEQYSPDAKTSNFEIRLEAAASIPSGSLEGIKLLVWMPGDFSYDIDLGNFVKSTDGEWYTVSIPLDKIAKGGTAFATTYKGFLDMGMHEMRLVINNSTDTGIPAIITIDNVRIVNTKI